MVDLFHAACYTCSCFSNGLMLRPWTGTEAFGRFSGVLQVIIVVRLPGLMMPSMVAPVPVHARGTADYECNRYLTCSPLTMSLLRDAGYLTGNLT